MKIKALERSTSSYQAPGSNVSRQPRNLDPAQHPFERAREYQRALTATKLSRMFAKPFVGQLGVGHVDGVYSMASDPSSLTRLASGSGDGVVKVWDLTTRGEVWTAKAHENIVKGLCWTRDAKLLTAGGVDKVVNLYDPYGSHGSKSGRPVATYMGKAAFTSLSHHRSESAFAASSAAGISIYDLSRPMSSPIQTLAWPTSVDTITSVAFNSVETSLLASTATDRGITLYDLRTASPLRRLILAHQSNAISWNPMEAFNLAVANEDHNIYIFDVRNLGPSSSSSAAAQLTTGGAASNHATHAAPRALNVLRDHVAAVMSVSFSPTGEELVTGSYDRTIRLWSRKTGHSRDIYHTKRMQRVFSTLFTQDSSYILSGSDDGNIRLWRSHASVPPGAVVSARQRQSLAYGDALRERYGHMPELRRIERHRHVPKTVKKATGIKRIEIDSLKRRDENRRKHEGKTVGGVKRKGERERMIIATEE